MEKDGFEKYAFWGYVLVIFLIVFVVCVSHSFDYAPVDSWFLTQDMLFSTYPPGTNNFAPIAAPAVFYRLNREVLKFSGLYSAVREYYSAMLFQNLLLFLSGIVLYRIGRMLGLGFCHTLLSVFYVVYVGSTFITMRLRSENISMPLCVLALYLAVKIYSGHKSGGNVRGWLSIALGICLGLLILTRASTVMLIPSVLLFFALARMEKKTYLRHAFNVVSIFLLILFLQMSSNYFRFGRFEYADSTGRHLWNAVFDRSSVILSDSEEYKGLAAHIGQKRLSRLRFWELRQEILKTGDRRYDGFINRNEYDEFLKGMVLDGIWKHPVEFLKHGIFKSLNNLVDTTPPIVPSKTSMQGGDGSTLLPTLLTHKVRYLSADSFAANRLSKVVYRYVALLTFLFIAYILCLPPLSRVGVKTGLFPQAIASSEFKERVSTYIPPLLFMGFAFFSIHYLNCQFEEHILRYRLVTLPFMVLMASIALKIVIPGHRVEDGA